PRDPIDHRRLHRPPRRAAPRRGRRAGGGKGFMSKPTLGDDPFAPRTPGKPGETDKKQVTREPRRTAPKTAKAPAKPRKATRSDEERPAKPAADDNVVTAPAEVFAETTTG